MKKSLFTLLLVIPLVACSKSSTSNISFSSLKATPSGHFTEAQKKYLSNDDETNTSPYNGNLSVYYPEPVHISWESDYQGPFQVNIHKGNDISLNYFTETNSFDFYNPLFNEEYTVSIFANDQESASFKFIETPSVPGPRNLKVDGVENFRDIGGWGYFENDIYKTYIKQGMLYRSGRFNEDKAEEVKATITKEGLYEIKNNFKIKTEIDLRRTSNNEVGGLTNKSVLGDDVNYIQLPMAFGGYNILTYIGKLSGDDYVYDNPAMIKKFFEILADENNYPINFHCSIGKDRTGCLAYLIEGLLCDGMTMHRDYMFTNFANAGMCKITDLTDTGRYEKTIMEYNTFNDNKVFAYLNEVVGISETTLNTVIRLLKA